MKNIFCYISLLCVALLSSCNTQKQSSALQDDESAIFSNPEQPAYYINGGDKGMLNDLYTTLFKTAPVSQDGVVGRAVVSFSIGKDSIIDPNSIKVERNRSVPQEYMDAAIEAIKKLGKFEPGKMNGTPLRVTYYLPIIYPLPLDQITKSELSNFVVFCALTDEKFKIIRCIDYNSDYTESGWLRRVFIVPMSFLSGESHRSLK